MKYKVWNEGGASSKYEDFSNRPVFADLFDLVDKGEVKNLWVYDVDRLSRNSTTASVIKLKLHQRQVSLFTRTGEYDFSNPQDKLMIDILTAMAEYENALRKARTEQGKYRQVLAGQWQGGAPPYGYCIKNKYLVVEPTEKKVVREIFTQYKKGKTASEISNYLLSKGVKTRRGNTKWSNGSVDALLTNTHYSGSYEVLFKHNNKKVKVQCPRLLPQKIIDDVLAEHSSRSRANRVKEASTQHFYLLRDFLKCGHCGSNYAGRIFEKQNRSVYYCPRKERNYASTTKMKKCNNSSYMKIADADELVWNTVIDTLSKSHLYKEQIKTQILTEQVHTPNKTLQQLKNKQRKLKRELKSYEGGLHNLDKEILVGRSSKKKEAFRKELIADKNKTSKELNDLESEITELQGNNRWIDWVSKFGIKVDELSKLKDDDKKEFLKNVIDHISVKTNKRTQNLTVILNYPYFNDSMVFKNVKDKKLGYDLIDGDCASILTIEKLKKTDR